MNPVTELISVGPPVIGALALAVGAAFVVRRLVFAKPVEIVLEPDDDN